MVMSEEVEPQANGDPSPERPVVALTKPDAPAVELGKPDPKAEPKPDPDAPEHPVAADIEAPGAAVARSEQPVVSDAGESAPAGVPVAEDPAPAAGEAASEEAVAGPAGSAPWKSPLLWILVTIVLLLVGSLTIYGVRYATRDVSSKAVTGNCLKNQGINPGSRKTSKVSLKVVSCDNSAAAYKVLGRINQQPESAASADSKLCEPFVGTQFIYWEGVEGKRGTVLCLASTKTATNS
jgi:hypothetical protein